MVLGPIKQAEFTLGELTILCGNNNTGKTYATYALFGFLSFWSEAFSIKVPEKHVSQLLNEGATELDIQDYINDSKNILANGCEAFTEQLPDVFASSEKHFSDSSFIVELEQSDFDPSTIFERTMGTAKKQFFSISKNSNSPIVNISLLVGKEKVKISHSVIYRFIGEALRDIIFGHLFPHPFIASAERTGAAIFRKELNFARNRLLDEMSSMRKDINPFDLLMKVYADYALPVKTNVDFTRQLEDLAKKDSFIVKHHPDLLQCH